MDAFPFGWSEIVALFSVIAIDVCLAGDNALVVGMAAAGLPDVLRKRAILIGILAAAGMRIIFAIFTMNLLKIVGLMAAGGLLLLWVSWKLWREIRAQARTSEIDDEEQALADAGSKGGSRDKTLTQAITQIVVADVSMSLDNVLAVSGAAQNHLWVLVIGLGLSVVLMGIAASVIAKLIHKHRWIAYVGLCVVLYVAVAMIWDGSHAVLNHMG